MSAVDYYKDLETDKSADLTTIQKQYRKLALKYHPDKNNAPDAFEYFRRVSEAYDVLSNHLFRAVYDQYGSEGLINGVAGRKGFVGGYAYHMEPMKTFTLFFGGSNPFSDFFAVNTESPVSEKKFSKNGGMSGKPAMPPTKNSPVVTDILLTLTEFYLGTVKNITISRRVLSNDGVTTTPVTKTLQIQIVKGWKEGTRITFPKEGDEGPNMIPADLVFVLKQIPDENFQRVGDDLHYTTNIKLVNALTGSTIKIRTLDDRILSIPVNDIIHPDYTKQVENEGMPLLAPNEKGYLFGNLVLKFKVEFPTYFSLSQKAELKKIFN